MIEKNKNLRILTFSTDKSILKESSRAHKRCIEYGELVEKYNVLLASDSAKQIVKTNAVTIQAIFCHNLSSVLKRIVVIFKFYAEAKKIIKDEKINIISSQDPFEYGFLAYVLSKKFKIGLHIQNHGDFFSNNYWKSENLLHFFRYYLGIFVMKKANSIRVVSKRIKKTLIEKLKINSSLIINVPILNEPESQAKVASTSRGKYEDKFVFLTIARLEREKNISLMVEAMLEVKNKIKNAHLLIVGDGREKNNLQNKTEKLKLNDSVEFVGWANNIFHYYNLADTYLLTSNHEGWGMVLIEAISAGLPIITTDVGCVGEVIIDKENALAIPVADKDALIAAMIKIASDSVLQQKLSTGAKLSYDKLFFRNSEVRLKRYQESWEIAILNI
jgi:1,2-diacylglycerol 3-alpha-glucosyltransferase